MKALELRKKTLLLESDVNRLTLHAELERLSDAAHELKQRITPWALVLAPVAGLTIARRWRRTSGGVGLMPKVLALAPTLIRLWRAWASSTDHAPKYKTGS